MKPTPWLLRSTSRPHRLRLYCFSYAGGNAVSYLPWQALVDADIEIRAVQLPGRGARMGETPCTSLPDVIRAIAGLLDDGDNVPFAFFGHSLGAVLAFEAARHCAMHGLPEPRQLFVSGCAAPQQRGESRNLHLLPDVELIDVLRGYQGTPPAVLASRELMQLLLPTIRADFSLVEGYRYSKAPLLEVPLIAFAGREDAISAAQMQAWEMETSRDFQLHWFEGGHFFINDHRQRIAEIVSEEMLGLLAPTSRIFRYRGIGAEACEAE